MQPSLGTGSWLDSQDRLVVFDALAAHISCPILVSLVTSAGWRMCVVPAFQTIGGLADCPADLTPEAVKTNVLENCAMKLIYAVRDSDMAEWLTRSTGIIRVGDETRHVARNRAFSESVGADRTRRQSETEVIDVNMLLALR